MTLIPQWKFPCLWKSPNPEASCPHSPFSPFLASPLSFCTKRWTFTLDHPGVSLGVLNKPGQHCWRSKPDGVAGNQPLWLEGLPEVRDCIRSSSLASLLPLALSKGPQIRKAWLEPGGTGVGCREWSRPGSASDRKSEQAVLMTKLETGENQSSSNLT